MGNGAIVPFFLADADNADDMAQANANIQTVRDYYAAVYHTGTVDHTGDDVRAVDDFVVEDFAIHRGGQVQRGREALKQQITRTFLDSIKLRIDLGPMVANRTMVAYTLTVTFDDVHESRMRINGQVLTRIEGNQIAETWVNYSDPEPDQGSGFWPSSSS